MSTSLALWFSRFPHHRNPNPSHSRRIRTIRASYDIFVESQRLGLDDVCLSYWSGKAGTSQGYDLWSPSRADMTVISTSSWIASSLRRSTYVMIARQSSVQNFSTFWSNAREMVPVPGRTWTGTAPPSHLSGSDFQARTTGLAWYQTPPSHAHVFCHLSNPINSSNWKITGPNLLRILAIPRR